MKTIDILIVAVLSTLVPHEHEQLMSAKEISFEKQMDGAGLPVVNSMIGGTSLKPRSFRSSEVVPFGRKKNINTEGLDRLHVSGSSQPSPNEMDEVKKFWANRKVHWITLRKEEVWAVEPKGGGAVIISQLHRLKWWSGEDPRGIRSVEQIHADEQSLVNAIPLHSTVTVYGNHDLEPNVETGEAYELLYRIDIEAETIFTLQQLVEQRGMIYHRISDNKFGPISWSSIDHLVNILKNIPEEDAVHFHCKKGQSRTTIAMALLDMMRNADKVSVEDILQRQGPNGLGGASLAASEVTTGKSGVPYKQSWEQTLKNFHAYCLEVKADNFKQTFSEWCKARGIKPEAEISFEHYGDALTIHSFLPAEDVKACNPLGLPDGEGVKGPLVLTATDEGKQLPSNLRSFQDHFFHASFNPEGLSSSYTVGSSQPTAEAAKIFFEQIKRAYPGKKIIDFDLRHDEHWLVYSGSNGHDVNAFETFAELGDVLSADELIRREETDAEYLMKQSALKLHVIKEMYPKDEYGDKYTLTLVPTKVWTEKKMMEQLGVEYVRIAAARFGRILDENVDQQIQMRKDNPEAVFYFHCKNGKSRTTLAMCFEDMMANADRVSMPDIVKRQHAIGGNNLFDITAKDPAWHQEREFKRQWLIFLVRFHAYCKEQKSQGFVKTWSEWSKENEGLPEDMPWEKLNQYIIDKTPT